MSKNGVSQIFEGKIFHFNGVIPRTLSHPSHSVEWRMAERHGATVLEELDMNVVTHLIYRPGYERSDKVRRALGKGISCVPINWMLDSLLQSRPIHESMVELKAIPDTVAPLGRSSTLPHHGHPYYVACAEDYHLFSPEERAAQKAELEAKQKQKNGDTSGPTVGTPTTLSTAALPLKADDKVPPLPQFGPLRQRKLPLPAIPGNMHLFHGLVFCFSPEIASDEEVATAAKGKGVNSISQDPNDGATTHLIYSYGDRKSNFLIDNLSLLESRTLQFVTQQWFEDCIMMNEILPNLGPYVPSDKLIGTLQKKRQKAQE